MLSEVKEVYFKNITSQRIDYWTRKREEALLEFNDALVPGERSFVSWQLKELLEKINLIHGNKVIPAPPYTMAELIEWLYGCTPAVPRWAYWFYDRNGNLRTGPTSIRGNDPYTWIKWWYQRIRKMGQKAYKKSGLLIPEGDGRGL